MFVGVRVWRTRTLVKLLYFGSSLSGCEKTRAASRPQIISQQPHGTFSFLFFLLLYLFYSLPGSLVCRLAYFCFQHACSLRLALHGQITSLHILSMMCVSVSQFVTTELVPLMYKASALVYLRMRCEASARTLVVLDVDGWKYQFHMKKHAYGRGSKCREVESYQDLEKTQPTAVASVVKSKAINTLKKHDQPRNQRARATDRYAKQESSFVPGIL